MAVQNSDLDCRKCSEVVKKIRGCEEDVEEYTFGSEKFTRCPLTLITQETRVYFEIYNSVKVIGGLYNSGGLGDQASKLIQIIKVIDCEIVNQRNKNGNK